MAAKSTCSSCTLKFRVYILRLVDCFSLIRRVKLILPSGNLSHERCCDSHSHTSSALTATWGLFIYCPWLPALNVKRGLSGGKSRLPGSSWIGRGADDAPSGEIPRLARETRFSVIQAAQQGPGNPAGGSPSAIHPLFLEATSVGDKWLGAFWMVLLVWPWKGTPYFSFPHFLWRGLITMLWRGGLLRSYLIRRQLRGWDSRGRGANKPVKCIWFSFFLSGLSAHGIRDTI